MTRWIALVLLLACADVDARPFVGPPEPPMERPTPEVARRVGDAVYRYASAIACEASRPEAIAMLEPDSAASRGVYAAVWSGDVGCFEGSHTREIQIAIVEGNGFGTIFVVDPARSSPQVEFEAPVFDVDRLVRNTADTLVLEGPGSDSTGAACRIRFAVRRDKRARWTTTWQRATRCR